MYPSNLLFGFYSIKVGALHWSQFIYTSYVSLNNWHLLRCAIERLRNGAYTTGQTNLFRITSPGDAGEL
ncbi:hypothetical protein D3G34_14765 [Escherichia coli]|nr:hypothetical protein AC789_1c14610 [Escherichia coli]EFA4487072.1 hypothetical protein [Escherichia coli]EFA4956108.1 hypothetical protein [Escherichia coli]EFA5171053.1 hypothetical protein [Escherichia coli]EFB8796313.1 hypothetical protein [Escherichia coli]